MLASDTHAAILDFSGEGCGERERHGGREMWGRERERGGEVREGDKRGRGEKERDIIQ